MTAGSAISARNRSQPAGAPAADPSPRGGGGRVRTVAAWLAVAVAMAALAVLAPVSIDEGQYVAPAAMAPGAQPFVDYLYLQTPLQAELVGPLGRLFPGWAFVALRAITGLMGAGVLGFAYLAQRLAGAARRTAIRSTALLAGCYTFFFACTVVRNDALPALLATGAVAAMLAAIAGKAPAGPAWGVAGLCLGLATSAKISYALPAAGAGLFLLIELIRRRQSVLALAAYGLGGLVGLVPSFLAWRAAPESFVYGVFTFETSTPMLWRAGRGEAWMVGLPANLLVTFGVLLLGPAMGALARVAGSDVGAGWRRTTQTPALLLLDLLILAGLVAAVLPTPTNVQYALPALPALFIRLGLTPPPATAAPSRFRWITTALMAVGLVVSVSYTVWFVANGRLTKGDWPALGRTREAHWIGERLRAAHASGVIATLRPEVVLDSGYPLDPRFATGPFVFRTAQSMPAAELARLKAVGPQTLGAAFDQAPPAAILVGAIPRFNPLMREAALARGYRVEIGPDRRFELYIRPAVATAQASGR